MKRRKNLFIAVFAFLSLALAAFAFTLAPNTREAAFADDGLEIVSVGGNPVSAELEDGKFVNGAFPMGHVGEAYSATLVAEGGSGNYTWSINIGSLATGLTLNASTGVVSGTPTGTATGSISVRVTDNETSKTDNVNLTFIVMADDWIPNIATTSVPNAVVGKSYTEELISESAVSQSIDWTVVSGELPTGLTLGKSGTFHGFLNGTPTATGTFNFTVKAENSYGSDTQAYQIVVEEQMTISFTEANYYLGDTVQFTASIGNANVNWEVTNNNSAGTTISESGLLTIADDETKKSVLVYATSKTNTYNGTSVSISFTNSLAYSITVNGGIATDSSENPITRAAENENVYIKAPEIAGKQFREWTVEAGSAAVTLGDENNSTTYFDMPAGNVILKANYDTVVDTVSAAFDTPVNGQHIDITIETGSANYTATLTSVWQGSYYLNIDEAIYETGKEYSFLIQFAPTAGNVMVSNNELNVTINGTALTFADDYISSYGSWRIVLTALSDAIPHYDVTVVSGLSNVSVAEAGDTVTITANAPAAHYEFDKWTTADGVTFANANSANTTFVMPAKNVTVTATYKLIKRTISFNANGGTGSKAAVEVNDGDSYALPGNPFTAPEGNSFAGWAYSATGAKIDAATIEVDANVELFALWSHVHDIHAVAAKAANCTEAGNIAHFECAGCHKLFSDELGEHELDPADVAIAALGHVWGEWTVTTPAQIGAPGEETRVCSRDANHKETRSVPALETVDSASAPVDSHQPAEEKKGMSGGAVAGIVAASVVVAGAGGFAVFWFAIKKKTFADLIAIFKKK